jgi:2-phospho-L-lactate guanylyltransferase (CobY/MobA/RfbA family)
MTTPKAPEIPDAALDAASECYHDASRARTVEAMLADVLAAALPHLVTDEMVERAVVGYREVAGRCSRQAMRVALTAATGGQDGD